jgi:membrane protease YdiL (CAAX protease family)
MRVSSMGRKKWLESLEAILVFVVPLLFAIPLYMLGFLTEVSGNYVTYTIYITCSIALTKYNGRSLKEIGLTRKELLPSLGLSGVTVLASFLIRLISAELQLSPEANSGVAVAQGLLFWTVSGLGQEILFRGLIFFSFYRWKGWKTALLVSSVLFGLMHVKQGITGIIFTVLIGGYWGWVAFKTKNIIGTSIAHSLFNFFTFLFVS